MAGRFRRHEFVILERVKSAQDCCFYQFFPRTSVNSILSGIVVEVIWLVNAQSCVFELSRIVNLAYKIAGLGNWIHQDRSIIYCPLWIYHMFLQVSGLFLNLCTQ